MSIRPIPPEIKCRWNHVECKALCVEHSHLLGGMSQHNMPFRARATDGN